MIVFFTVSSVRNTFSFLLWLLTLIFKPMQTNNIKFYTKKITHQTGIYAQHTGTYTYIYVYGAYIYLTVFKVITRSSDKLLNDKIRYRIYPGKHIQLRQTKCYINKEIGMKTHCKQWVEKKIIVWMFSVAFHIPKQVLNQNMWGKILYCTNNVCVQALGLSYYNMKLKPGWFDRQNGLDIYYTCATTVYHILV